MSKEKTLGSSVCSICFICIVYALCNSVPPIQFCMPSHLNFNNCPILFTMIILQSINLTPVNITLQYRNNRWKLETNWAICKYTVSSAATKNQEIRKKEINLRYILVLVYILLSQLCSNSLPHVRSISLCEAHSSHFCSLFFRFLHTTISSLLSTHCRSTPL